MQRIIKLLFWYPAYLLIWGVVLVFLIPFLILAKFIAMPTIKYDTQVVIKEEEKEKHDTEVTKFLNPSGFMIGTASTIGIFLPPNDPKMTLTNDSKDNRKYYF